MESYEFMAIVHRLGMVAAMIARTNLGGAREQIQHAETVAPLFDPAVVANGSTRLTALRRFIAASETFKLAALDYYRVMAESGAEPPLAPPPPPLAALTEKKPDGNQG